VKLEPDGVLGLYGLAYLYSGVGRHDKAIGLIERVVETTERNPTFRAMLVLILAAAGRMEEVRPILDEVPGTV